MINFRCLLSIIEAKVRYQKPYEFYLGIISGNNLNATATGRWSNENMHWLFDGSKDEVLVLWYYPRQSRTSSIEDCYFVRWHEFCLHTIISELEYSTVSQKIYGMLLSRINCGHWHLTHSCAHIVMNVLQEMRINI